MVSKGSVLNFTNLIVLVLLAACGGPTVQDTGGTIVKIQSANQNTNTTQSNLLERFSTLSKAPENITTSITDNVIKFELPAVFDTATVRSLVAWNRSFRLVRGLNPSTQIRVRAHLSDLLTIPEKTKPYKPSSMIGLVTDNQRKAVIAKISAKAFKEEFPEVRNYYWGAKKMDGQSALFMESSESTFITEDMFSQLEGHASKDNSEGEFGLQLKEAYADRIGQLTGNDSVYLLHIFHQEVYISKIIKPHITQPNFGMSGAFSVAEAETLGTLWASEELDPAVRIIALELVEGK